MKGHGLGDNDTDNSGGALERMLEMRRGSNNASTGVFDDYMDELKAD